MQNWHKTTTQISASYGKEIPGWVLILTLQPTGNSSGADVGMSKPPQAGFSAWLYFPAGQCRGNPTAPCSHQQHCSFGSCRKIPLNGGCMQIGQRSPCPVQTGSAWELIFFVLRKKAKTHKKKKKREEKERSQRKLQQFKGCFISPQKQGPLCHHWVMTNPVNGTCTEQSCSKTFPPRHTAELPAPPPASLLKGSS